MSRKTAKTAALALAAFFALAGLGLWRFLDGWMPVQGWAVWGGGRWSVAASGWPVLWHAWPVALAGGLAGFFGAGGALLWGLALARDAEIEAEIGRLRRTSGTEVAAEKERLGRKWDEALARVESRVGGREAAALKAQHEAEAARRQAEQECLDAEAIRQDAYRRIRNAVAAAERIKRKSNISALADGQKSARNGPPEPPR